VGVGLVWGIWWDGCGGCRVVSVGEIGEPGAIFERVGTMW
jgi:hypothetical protein